MLLREQEELTMSIKVKDYYDNLKIIDALKEDIKLKREAFEETFSKELEELKSTEEKNSELKELIKTDSIKEYEETGEKKLSTGLGIRVTTKLIYEESDAIKWAKENMLVAIKETIDKKQFESFVKSNELEFVEKIETPGVTFPKELKPKDL